MQPRATPTSLLLRVAICCHCKRISLVGICFWVLEAGLYPENISSLACLFLCIVFFRIPPFISSANQGVCAREAENTNLPHIPNSTAPYEKEGVLLHHRLALGD